MNPLQIILFALKELFLMLSQQLPSKMLQMLCWGSVERANSLQIGWENDCKEVKCGTVGIVKTEPIHTFRQVKMNHLLVHWWHRIDSYHFLRPFRVIALIHHLITAQEPGLMGHSSHVLLWWEPCIRQEWHGISTLQCPFIFASFLFNFESCLFAISLPHTSALSCPWGVDFNSLVSLFDFELKYTAAATTGKRMKYHNWNSPLLIFAGLLSGRTCEFAPHHVWCPDVVWSSWVMRDSSHKLFASWRVTRWEKPVSGWIISPRRWRGLKENWKLASHEMVMLLLLIQPKCSCQSEHGSYIYGCLRKWFL